MTHTHREYFAFVAGAKSKQKQHANISVLFAGASAYALAIESNLFGEEKKTVIIVMVERMCAFVLLHVFQHSAAMPFAFKSCKYALLLYYISDEQRTLCVIEFGAFVLNCTESMRSTAILSSLRLSDFHV